MARILLKLSGEALGNETESLDALKLSSIAEEVKKIVNEHIEVGIVVGGGNYARGRSMEKAGFDRLTADQIGMLGTVMNALALRGALEALGIKAHAMSAVEVASAEKHDPHKAQEYLSKGEVVIFGGGTGRPFFSTDTTAALCALEIEADLILMAKNGVDGVYSADPDVVKTAVRYEVLTFDDILKMNLQVIDATAAIMCKERKLSAFVFDMNKPGNIYLAALGQAQGTKIS